MLSTRGRPRLGTVQVALMQIAEQYPVSVLRSPLTYDNECSGAKSGVDKAVLQHHDSEVRPPKRAAAAMAETQDENTPPIAAAAAPVKTMTATAGTVETDAPRQPLAALQCQ